MTVSNHKPGSDAGGHLFYQTRQRRPVLERAQGVYLWDVDGKRYLDGSSGAMVCNIGHSNKHVLDAMRRQMDKSTFGYRLQFETEAAEQLASRTAALMPDGINRLFFVSGGSEAVESAIKLARQYTLAIGDSSRYKIISRYPSYHGCTLGALGLTGYSPMTSPFAPMLHESPKIDAPTCYLDNDGLTDESRGQRYANQLEEEIKRQGAETVLAFIVEPVGGASTGALVPPPGYMERIREICDQYGVLLIYDEVMTGAGRTGCFLAADHFDAQPDLIVLSKGFAAGYVPLGALAARDDMVETVLDNGGFIHGFTYAGNPLACAAGLAVLEEIQTNNLVANAAKMGDILRGELDGLMSEYPFIGDVRGLGLLLAFEMVNNRDTMAPLAKELNAYHRLVEIAYEAGLIIYSRRTRGGLEGDHFMICPPLIVDTTHIDEIMEKLRISINRFAYEAKLDRALHSAISR
ncbi:MAG: aspartate aminotransferase family protein [marine bacterium B5-7]|nr:MAG: aspartate aminotransferase family protein [marine bacterium B5-7]